MTKLNAPATFFAELRRRGVLGPTLTDSEVDGVNAILAACGAANWGPRWTAYALATADRETAGTMQPIKEYGGQAYFTRLYDVMGRDPARAKAMGNTEPGDGARYCGRGYVQLTWKSNYARAELELEHNLVAQPDLAMRPDIAAAVMVRGMEEGWFTGKKLADYITGDRCDYVNARRIINGLDHAQPIAAEAEHYLAALRAGVWS